MEWTAGPDRFTLTGSEGILCFTTMRGKALPPGDLRAKAVPQARQRLWPAAGGAASEAVGMEQVHGAGVVRVEPGAAGRILPGCDGLITDRRGVSLVVRTADCLPLVAWDPGRGLLGVAHAGWRGVRAGLPGRLARAMGTAGLRVAIGPGIGPCCYEVGPEFSGWFPGHLRISGAKIRLDLAGAAAAQMEEAGVDPGRIVRAPWCTACEKERCCSYRREGEAAGRMATCAVMV